MGNMADNAFTAENDIISPDDMGADTAEEEAGAAAGDGTTGSEQSAEQEQKQEENADVTRTRAFAQRLRERTDTTIASVGLINPYNGQPINNERDLRAYRRMQMAESNGEDPNSAAGESELLERLNEYELREQEASILADPELAPFYEEYRDDVQMICNMARLDNKDIDMGLALRTVMAQHMDDIRKRDAERIRNETIKSYNARSRATPGALGGSDISPVMDYSKMSDADFDNVLQKALRGELSGN